MWGGGGEYGTAGQTTDDSILRRILVACGITRATNTPLENVIVITFPLQQLLRERAPVLRW